MLLFWKFLQIDSIFRRFQSWIELLKPQYMSSNWTILIESRKLFTISHQNATHHRKANVFTWNLLFLQYLCIDEFICETFLPIYTLNTYHTILEEKCFVCCFKSYIYFHNTRFFFQYIGKISTSLQSKQQLNLCITNA